MTLPDVHRLYRVIAETWPPAKEVQSGPWTLRDGAGGRDRISSRVSSVTADGAWTDADIPAAEAGCRTFGQVPLFMIRAGETVLDDALAARGYRVKDPVTLYSARCADVVADIPPVSAFEVWPPLEVQKEIWRPGGIGDSRLAVMHRASGTKTTILGRLNDRPAGAVFVALGPSGAMLHALEVAQAFRRQGLARILTAACARFARQHGAEHLSLVTTTENTAANALYRDMGFAEIGHYHYRIHPEAP